MNYKSWYSKVVNKEQDKEQQPEERLYNNMTWNEWLDYINDPRVDIEPEIRDAGEQYHIEEIPY